MPVKKRPRTKKKEQPHDAVFKAFFNDTKIAKNFMLHYTQASVHSQIDFSIFEKSNTAFVSGRFGVSFSDVVYETRLINGGFARLLFLLEHKSYVPSQPIYLQLLDYLLQIWEDDLKNKRPLSFIIPIVVYHGDIGWEQKPFSDYFPGLPKGWQSFIPGFNYLLTDLSQIPPQVINDKAESEYLRNLFLALKFARDEDLIRKNWKEIFTFGVTSIKDDRERILLQTLTLYIIKLFDMPNTEVKTLNKQLPEPERNWMDSVPEVLIRDYKRKLLKDLRAESRELGLKEGREEGRKEGRQEGREEGREEKTQAANRVFTIKTIQKFPDWSDVEVAEFVGVRADYVQQLRLEVVK